MSGKRYTDEFKIEAVKQVAERGQAVADVARRLGITTHSLYAWKMKFDRPEVVQQAELNQDTEIRRLKVELKRMTEERDILKKGRRVLCQGITARYAFMYSQLNEFRLSTMCRVLGVHRGGYYAWQSRAPSNRARENERLQGLIKHHGFASGGVYGYPALLSQDCLPNTEKGTIPRYTINETCLRKNLPGIHAEARTQLG